MTNTGADHIDGTVETGKRIDAEATIEQIRARGERVKRAHTERAIERLRERTDLDDSDEQALEALAAGLTDALLQVPERRLAELDDGERGDDLARTAVALFGEE